MAGCQKSTDFLMEGFPHLSQAPIVEALIDLRINPEKEWNPEALKDGVSRELPEYPNIDEQRLVQTQVVAKRNEAPQAEAINLGLRGYFFRTEDKLQVAQFQRDGFAFSRLKPYENWRKLERETHRLWDVYQKYVSIRSIARLGVRFINRIEAPLEGKISEYFVNIPETPCNLEWTFNEFMHRDVFEIPDSPYNIILTRTMRPEPSPTPNKVVFYVDIDIFSVIDLAPNRIWEEHLNRMHYLKNRVFFGSIQPLILEGMK